MEFDHLLSGLLSNGWIKVNVHVARGALVFYFNLFNQVAAGVQIMGVHPIPVYLFNIVNRSR